MTAVASASPLVAGWSVHSLWLRRRLVTARRDPLTGLWTRRDFERAAGHLAGRGPATVVLIDLDGFKQVNDRHGHHVGDLVIRGAGHGLTEWNNHIARGVVARLGGDEFAACFPAPDPDRARLTLSSLHGLLTAPLLVGDPDSPVVAVGASVGACWVPDPGAFGLPALLRRADEAMYAVKRGGGGVLLTTDPGTARGKVNGRRPGRRGAAGRGVAA
jgi:diguanylate cyclase (GGDEF)-like protein